MADQVTTHPPFEPPPTFKKARLWAERKVLSAYSDGDQRHWPGGPKWRPMSEDYYLCVLAQRWAEKDGIARQGVQYYLDKLPHGYAMFEAETPAGDQTYKRLYGHPKGRFFDSAQRFTPHFLWLMSGMVGLCECVCCGSRTTNPPVQRRARVPRETAGRSLSHLQGTTLRDLTDDEDANVLGNDSSRSSSARDFISKRLQRQVRCAGGVPVAVDEEGTEDVWKDCVKKLENAKDGTRGVEIDIAEDGSIDWKAERESLPQHLTQIEHQHSFVPRIGELVLWCPDFLDDHYLLHDQQTSEFKFFSFDQQRFSGFPAWRGGVVVAAPSAAVKNGPIDFADILDLPSKKTSFNTSGFRIETAPDPNDDLNKSVSKQYKYVPLRQIRPLAHWQILLRGIPKVKLHPSIEYALTCMTSLTLVEKWRFNGDWPNGRIFCKAIYLGSELITVGDAIRLTPSQHEDQLQPDVMIVDSIRYNLLDMQPEHARRDNPYLCGSSYIAFVGSAYTMDAQKLLKSRPKNRDIDEPVSPISTLEVKKLFRPVGTEEYGQWFLWHDHEQKYEVSHEQVLGRLCEADAVRLWMGQRQTAIRAQDVAKPSLTFDLNSVISGRRYATEADARLPEPQTKSEINWHLADTRVEGLAVASVNGVDVGNYHDVRTPATLRQWRLQVRVADGHQLAPEIERNYIRDLSQIKWSSGGKRGRKAGSKIIDGKVVLPGELRANIDSHDEHKSPGKPSSQMAGAALATDHEDSSADSYSDDVEIDDENEETEAEEQNLLPNMPTATKAESKLSKVAIMSSTEIPDYDDDDDDDDDFELEDALRGEWPLQRGGTEETEGGDYRE